MKEAAPIGETRRRADGPRPRPSLRLFFFGALYFFTRAASVAVPCETTCGRAWIRSPLGPGVVMGSEGLPLAFNLKSAVETGAGQDHLHVPGSFLKGAFTRQGSPKMTKCPSLSDRKRPLARRLPDLGSSLPAHIRRLSSAHTIPGRIGGSPHDTRACSRLLRGGGACAPSRRASMRLVPGSSEIEKRPSEQGHARYSDNQFDGCQVVGYKERVGHAKYAYPGYR